MKINKKIRKKRLRIKFLKGAIRISNSTNCCKRKANGLNIQRVTECDSNNFFVWLDIVDLFTQHEIKCYVKYHKK